MALERRIDRLEEALGRLVEAQARTEVALTHLTEAQAHTEVRLGRLEEAVASLTEGQRQLTEAQIRTEVRLGRLEEALTSLTEAQARTEATLQETQRTLQQLTRQVGGLSDTVGGDIEDIAYIVLHDVLAREFDWQVGVLERTWQRWDGAMEEVNIFGQATDPAQPERTIWIVGEAKHNLTLREVDQFVQQVTRSRRHLTGEVYAVCFAYRARPEVRERLRAQGIPLLFSYGRFA